MSSCHVQGCQSLARSTDRYLSIQGQYSGGPQAPYAAQPHLPHPSKQAWTADHLCSSSMQKSYLSRSSVHAGKGTLNDRTQPQPLTTSVTRHFTGSTNSAVRNTRRRTSSTKLRTETMSPKCSSTHRHRGSLPHSTVMYFRQAVGDKRLCFYEQASSTLHVLTELRPYFVTLATPGMRHACCLHQPLNCSCRHAQHTELQAYCHK